MNAESSLSPTKKRIFTLILILTPFLLLALLELGLRAVDYGGNLDLFVTGPEEQISHYWMCNPNIGERYFFKQNTKPSPPKDLFLKDKPENGYRIFTLGGSTTAGFPYGYNLMFPRILNFRLDDIFPDRHIEVVNTAMSAVNSYTMYDLMDEILAYEPDVLLIYAGHNEFYGAMGVGSQETLGKRPGLIYTYLKLRRLKLFLAVRDIVGSLQKGVSRLTTGGTEVDPTNTLMARIVAEQSIPYKSELYERGIRQYENNLRRILEKAQQHQVPVVLSELVSNVKDQEPFVSVDADTFPTAARAYEIGQKLLAQGDVEDARTALHLAKDLDALRFRATEEMNEIIHRLGEEFNVPVAPIKGAFELQSEHQLIGNELILEHLHPNMQGYFLMAEVFLKTMYDHGMVSQQWDTSRIRPMQYYQENWGLTAVDTLAAELSIRYLKGGWPFQPALLPNRTLDNYVADTFLDSVVLRILIDQNYSETVGHVDMAKYYESRSQYDKAAAEYKAAYYTIPFELEFYKGAAKNLIQQREYSQALEVLQRAQRYGTTPYITKWTGQLLAAKGDVNEALPYLEQARDELGNDPQVLQTLVSVYEKIGATAKAQQLASQLQETSAAEQPQSVLPSELDQEKQNILYSALMQKATSFIENNQYDKALPLLKSAHSIRESAFTFKWIGLLDLNAGRLQEGVEFLEQAIELRPQDFELHYNLCNAYIHLEQKQDAQRILEAMERLRPNFDDPQNLRPRVAELP